MTIYRSFGKRVFDAAGAAMLLVFLSPLMVVVAVLVRMRLGAPVLFKQMRPGLRERPFTLLKFRTMLDAVDASGEPLPDERRMTTLGSVLRKLSLDELPELINVLRGEMSLVGPRPLLAEYLPLYSPEQRRRHDVRPGITGLAQVRGRNRLSWERKFELDVEYVNAVSALLDLKILALTAAAVVLREGINEEGVVTARKFTGTR